MHPWRSASRSRAASGAAWSEPNARVSPEVSAEQDDEGEEVDVGRWSALVPELLNDILRRVDADAERWPQRRDVVVFACMCRRWREAAVALVRPTLHCGGVTFLSSLEQPGPTEAPIQCFIKRNKKNLTFHLYLSLTQALIGQGKFLLAARRNRRAYHMEYIISVCKDLSHGSHVGKLKSDFTKRKFTIYDQQLQYEGAKVPISRCRPRLACKQINPLASTDNVETGGVSMNTIFANQEDREEYTAVSSVL